VTNFDGIIDILDIVRIINQIMGNSELNEDEFTAADFNADGIVDILDIIQIVNYILANLKKSTTFLWLQLLVLHIHFRFFSI